MTNLRSEEEPSGETARESEDHFRALVQATSDVVYRMSADWTEMHHLRGRDFVADTHEPTRTWLQKYIHPSDQPQVTQAVNEAIQGKKLFQLEHRALRKDGTFGWTFSRAVPVLDGAGQIVEWLGAASDVTARHEAARQLRESEDRAAFVRRSSEIGFCSVISRSTSCSGTNS